MITIPFALNEREYSIFVALEDDNIARMRQYDPAEVTRRAMPEPWQSLQLRDVIIGWATAADIEHVTEMLRSGADQRKALQYLSRGWAFRPEAGDSDDRYKSAR